MTKNMKAVVDAVKNRTEYYNSREPAHVVVRKHGIFVWLYQTIIYAKVHGHDYWSDGGWNTRTTSRYISALGGIGYSISEKKNKMRLRTQREMLSLSFNGKLK